MKNNDINNNKLLSLQYNCLLYLILLTNGVVSLVESDLIF